MSLKNDFLVIYDSLKECFGYQNWWPGDTPFEIVIGAILTQNTSWKNVEKAIIRLKENNLLNYKSIKAIEEKELAVLITSSGYYNQKAKKIKNFIAFVDSYAEEGIFENLWGKDKLPRLRENLLTIKGIGPETADSILLYAGNLPTFVIDTYTKRIFSRLGFGDANESYDFWQKKFLKNLPSDTLLFNDYHAQIVVLAKEFCKKQKPSCPQCPLENICKYKANLL